MNPSQPSIQNGRVMIPAARHLIPATGSRTVDTAVVDEGAVSRHYLRPFSILPAAEPRVTPLLVNHQPSTHKGTPA